MWALMSLGHGAWGLGLGFRAMFLAGCCCEKLRPEPRIEAEAHEPDIPLSKTAATGTPNAFAAIKPLYWYPVHLWVACFWAGRNVLWEL